MRFIEIRIFEDREEDIFILLVHQHREILLRSLSRYGDVVERIRISWHRQRGRPPSGPFARQLQPGKFAAAR